ncbi:MAG: Glu/Leu/Phe/Val dehydrogenase dimerization domain-containing protein, partial [Candidatus Micrarchaeota archaeon]
MDKYGPEKILQVYNPTTGTLGILIIDSTTLGPGLGGVYFAKNVTVELAFERARLHTLMNSLHGIPFGGGCAYINKGNDMRLDLQEFASGVAPFANRLFVAQPGDDIDEEYMELYAYSSGDIRGTVGKPSALKGIPFDTGAVGLGIGHCVLETMRVRGVDGNARVSLHGLGKDSLFAARLLAKRGAKITAISDGEKANVQKEGFGVEHLTKMMSGGMDLFGGEVDAEEALKEPVDVLLTTAPLGTGLFNEVKPRIIAECRLGALDSKTKDVLENEGITVLPGILACGGASLSSYIEYIGGNIVQM